ncbi:MAG TPA: hypothetical protein VGD04_07255 [Methylophilus sp.]
MALKITQHCPCCSGHVTRTQRRTGDRILSLFVEVKRYQCQNEFCAWEGNIKVPKQRLWA